MHGHNSRCLVVGRLAFTDALKATLLPSSGPAVFSTSDAGAMMPPLRLSIQWQRRGRACEAPGPRRAQTKSPPIQEAGSSSAGAFTLGRPVS